MVPELVVHADDSSGNAKHDAFAAREAEVSGKLLVLNIRRLPSWSLSFAQHHARDGVHPRYEPMPLPTAAELAERTLPDAMLRHFTANGRFRVDRWLRTEHLAEDFLELVAALADVPEDLRAQVHEIGMINTIPYDHDVAHWFSDAQIATMYERNPVWASIEQRVYGSEVQMGVTADV